MGVPGTCSFIYSILNIMETDFLLKGPIQKEKVWMNSGIILFIILMIYIRNIIIKIKDLRRVF